MSVGQRSGRRETQNELSFPVHLAQPDAPKRVNIEINSETPIRPGLETEDTVAKNILVFADGTGNEGGLLPDESRTNVYKLFRATRNGPDSGIDPRKQVAFYLHEIGTPTPGGSPRKIRQSFEQMFGGGLGSRITDSYAAIASVWQPGDRIYLFGFSRGAYTARCLAHVLELFGIPAKERRSHRDQG